MSNDEHGKEIKEIRARFRPHQGILSRSDEDLLVRALESEHPFTVRAAATAVCRLGARASTRRLIAAMIKVAGHRHRGARYAAIRALGALATSAAIPEVVHLLSGLLESRSLRTRQAAARAAINVKRASEPLVCALAHADGIDGAEAISIICAEDPAADRLVANMLTNVELRDIALQAIERMPLGVSRPEVLDALMTVIDVCEVSIKGRVAEAAIRINGAAQNTRLLARVSELLRSGDEATRNAIVQVAICACSCNAPESFVDDLVTTAKGASFGARVSAAQVLAKLGLQGTRLSDVIESLVITRNIDLVQTAALLISTAVGEPSLNSTGAVLDGLASLLRDGGSADRTSAIRALTNLREQARTPRFLGQLAEMLHSSDDSGRTVAVCAAISATSTYAATPEILSGLNDLLRSGRPLLVQAAARACDGIGPSAASAIVDSFEFALRHEAPSTKRVVAICSSVLAASVTPGLLDTLLDLLKSQDSETRKAGVLAVRRIGRAAETFEITSTLRSIGQLPNSASG